MAKVRTLLICPQSLGRWEREKVDKEALFLLLLMRLLHSQDWGL